MRKAFALSVALILALLLTAPATHAKSLILNNAPTQVYFSPNGGCTEAIVKEITNAKSEILVQATNMPFLKRLAENIFTQLR
jgi:hypothetical protein